MALGRGLLFGLLRGGVFTAAFCVVALAGGLVRLALGCAGRKDAAELLAAREAEEAAEPSQAEVLLVKLAHDVSERLDNSRQLRALLLGQRPFSGPLDQRFQLVFVNALDRGLRRQRSPRTLTRLALPLRFSVWLSLAHAGTPLPSHDPHNCRANRTRVMQAAQRAWTR